MFLSKLIFESHMLACLSGLPVFCRIYYAVAILCVPCYYGLHVWNYDLKIRDIQLDKSEGYMHFRFPVLPMNQTSYIIQIIPERNVNFTHHMILYGCTDEVAVAPHMERVPADSCGLLLYAWAHHAPDLRLPPGIGIAVGESEVVKSFQLELHYLVEGRVDGQPGLRLILTDEPQPKVANVFLMFREDGLLPKGEKQVNLDISCRVPYGKSFTVMAMRTHAHRLGRAVFGYRQPRDKNAPLQFLGSGNPQWPQSFYSLRSLGAGFDSIDVQEGDILLARCSYDTQNETKATQIGSTHNDEMCNLYIMYYSDPNDAASLESGFCSGDQFPSLWNRVSADASALPPALPPSIASHSGNDILETSMKNPIPLVNPPERLRLDDLKLGMISSLATVPSSDGCELIILHQPNRLRGEQSLPMRHGPFISGDVVTHVNPTNMHICRSWGAGLFIHPYSLTVSFRRPKGGKVDDNTQREPEAVFVVDLALQQVLKFAWGHFEEPAMTLGERFDPGSAPTQFCQPTDVAVTSAGEIVVADGYCNSRIVKFSANGSYISHWPASGILNDEDHRFSQYPFPRGAYRALHGVNFRTSTDEFRIVHSVAVISSEDGSLEQICAADRDNAAVVCYTLEGDRIAKYAGAGLLPSVYSIAYSRKYRRLFGTTGSSDASGKSIKAHGFMLNPVKPRAPSELHSNLDNGALSVTEESAAVSGFFTTLDVVARDFVFSSDELYLYFTAAERDVIFRSKLESFQDSVWGNAMTKAPANRFEQFWVLYTSDGPRLVGLIMLFILVLSILTFFGVRMCCYRRKLSRNYRDRARPNRIQNTGGSRTLSFSRWGRSRESQARRAGFMPLAQDGDPLELEDLDDENDLNDNGDVLFESKYAGFTRLPVSAENLHAPMKPPLANSGPKGEDNQFNHSATKEYSPSIENGKKVNCVA